ncbi:MAG: SDR family NAD(P)-dependent oxidoreductase [Endozoicomonas sp.]
MKDFKNKVAVVTGGASGVGKSICKLLASEGAKVVVSDIEEGALDKAVSEITAAGGECFGKQGDVTKEDSMQALADAAVEKYGEIDLVFANAGVGTGEGGMMWEYTKNDWDWGFSVNMYGVINTIKAFMPILVKQKKEAHFTITGSGNGAFIMIPGQPIYSATKAAVQAIAESLYFQMMPYPVNVSALFPGPHVVDTGIFNSGRNRPEELAGRSDQPDSGISSLEDMENMMKSFGMELKTTHPDEVAETALQGIRDNKFWISPMNDGTKQAIRDRTESIVTQTNHLPPNVL